ncbi:DMT family transporter [Arsenicicoccus piscis]|uniref:ABC transporter permease n=1 Tax=Arsenicicoccus piscis TaxID=673954 RepID=A0ABQ6HNK2_9MICO|nr:EamA family transporter [Arsenicicoccus piscis]MCH8629034.1 DMT family transporter [Arsenicicoccus piscis]GMA19653.1 ABC transporter permease [Arsenicicoccus piscis]
MEATSKTTLTLLGAVAPVTWGTTYAVTTELLPPDRPMTAAALRAVPAGLILLLVAPEWPRQWDRIMVLSLLNIGAFFPLLFVAAYRLPGGLAAVVGAAQPFIVAVAAWSFFRERTPVRQLLWALVAVLGVAMTLAPGTQAVDPVGILAATAGTASMALGVTLTRAWGPTSGLTGLGSTAWQLLMGGLMILPLIPLFDDGQLVLSARAVLGYAWLSIVGGALAYALWFHAARSLPAASTSLLGPLSPVTAALLGWLLLGETLTLQQTVGFVLALAAAVLGQRRSGQPVRRRRRRHSSPTSTLTAGGQ